MITVPNEGTNSINPSINRIIDAELSEVGYSEPIGLELAKQYMRITTGNEENEIIELMITAARKAIEEFCLLSLVPKTARVILEPFSSPMEIPFGPVVSGVIYTDANGNVTYPTQVGYQFPEVQQYYGRLQLEYECGYTSDGIPKDLKIAILDQLTFMYENRGDNSDSSYVCNKAQIICMPHSRRALFQ